ncbi:MAG: alanine/glycine:cation symporter family protein [Myxococcota bacterium]|nr:alanine/glycine:cation symporter family protein [Myxococcota bacterium]
MRRAFAAWFSVFVLVSAGLAPRAVAQDAEATVEPAQPAATAETETESSALDAVDAAFGTWVVGPLAAVLFFDLVFWDDADEGLNLPFIVLWLVLGATFFTLRMGFINLRGFGHAVMITTGKYDDPEAEGEVSHFQALASALSATVGLGNIAGVAIAVSLGGPGAIFWMVVAGFLGMSSKFVECTLGQMYRQVDDKGAVLGGPMRYLAAGVEKLGYPRLGKVLAVVFAVMCIGGSFGGGNMFQANQAYAQVARVVPFFEDKSWLFGIVIAFLVGLVIIGGIKRIGQVAGAIVPAMCAVYVLSGIAILVMNADAVPGAFAKIIGEALSLEAGFGGLLGVLVVGFQRAAFSNEAGIGSASIAHSAAATKEPIREGLVALLEPFIDTIIICTMTGLVVVVTGEYLNTPEVADSNVRGVLMTSAAFASVFEWFPYVLATAVLLFAFSTMISWSYYGERCWVFLFGAGSSVIYRVIFVLFVVLGSILKLGSVLAFSDYMILGMAFPNIFGLFLLNKQVRDRLDDYWNRWVSGAIPIPGESPGKSARD